MQFIEKNIKILPEHGFSEENDIFNRKAIGINLHKLLTNSQENLVVCIDNEWGEGKTTFLKMWQGYLDEKQATYLYFDAFKNDIISDPLSALLGEIYIKFAEEFEQDKSYKELFVKYAVSVAKAIGVGSLKASIRFATMGAFDCTVLDGNQADSNKDDAYIAGELANATGKAVESYLESYAMNKGAIDEFKQLLSKLVEKKLDNKPLIFIIDELDRCKPSYAVELLEVIKHVFSVPGVQFVLSMNREALEESIKGQYGNGIKANIYLQKFIDLSLTLPTSFGRYQSKSRRKYIYHLISKTNLNGFWIEDFIEAFSEFAEHKELSFRDIEKMFPWILMLLNTNSDEFASLSVLLIYLKVTDKKQFNLISNLSADFDYRKAFGFVESNFESYDVHLKDMFVIMACTFDVKSGGTMEQNLSSISNEKIKEAVAKLLPGKNRTNITNHISRVKEILSYFQVH